MRLCRLLFLAGFWLWAGAASAQPFDDPAIGFSIVKPPGWFFVDEKEIDRSRQMQKLDNEALEALIKKNSQYPLVVLSKFKEPYDDANLVVSVSVKPIGPFKGAGPVQVVKAIAAGMAKMHKSVKLEEFSDEVRLAGLPAAYCQFTKVLTTPTGDIQTRNRIWIVKRQEHFFMITGSARQDERNGTLAEVDAVIRSITIDLRS